MIKKIKFKQKTALLFLSVLYGIRAIAADPASAFHDANELFQQQKFVEAAGAFENLLAEGYRVPEVYFNLGNCYYKNDQIAKAILNYERAKKLSPGDEDIAFNLRLTQLKTIDKIEPLPQIFYKRWGQQITQYFSTDQWGMVFLICLWLIFIFLSAMILSPAVPVKKISAALSFFFLLLTLLSFSFAVKSYRINTLDKRGVIMSPSVYVKSAPGDHSTDLLMLHEGSDVDILDEYNGWMKIRIANGSEGWVEKEGVETV